MLRLEMLGHLGHDPETRYMPSGSAVVNFSMAHTNRWRDKDSGEQKEHTEWVRFVAFNKQAEIIAEHCKKGSQLWVAGMPKTRSFEKDGQTHYTWEVRVSEFEFVGKKNTSDSQDRPAPPGDDFDDDIPF